MQKITEKLKNTPSSVQSLLARSSVSFSLNKEETLSEKSKVRSVISPEGVQPEYTQGLKADYVYVLSVEGSPLMPCKPAKAKHLLKAGKAKVVKKYPFVIQLCFECENQVQKITLGIDSGYENIGFSAVTEVKELISGTLRLDDKTSKRLTERRMYRNGRRNKLWHRKPRFLNRAKKKGWLPPSIQRRYDTHLNLIIRLKKILPISEVIVETAKFDTQKLINSGISGVEYQQGSLYDYQNMRSYLMTREKGRCQLCGKDFKGQPSHIHHCKQRSECGSNRPENLAILHKKCHDKLHKKDLKLSKPKSYKPNTFMSIIHNKFKQDIPSAKITYGYITFVNRNKLGIEKSHVNDAFVIAEGTLQERCKEHDLRQTRRHNRSIQLNRRGSKPAIRTSIYKIQHGDFITIAGKILSAVGIHCKGSRVQVKINNCLKSISTGNIESIYSFGSLVWN